jgi:hypothetical protein
MTALADAYEALIIEQSELLHRLAILDSAIESLDALLTDRAPAPVVRDEDVPQVRLATSPPARNDGRGRVPSKVKTAPQVTRRKWTDDDKRAVLAYAAEHGRTPAAERFSLHVSLIDRWRRGAATKTERQDIIIPPTTTSANGTSPSANGTGDSRCVHGRVTTICRECSPPTPPRSTVPTGTLGSFDPDAVRARAIEGMWKSEVADR